MILQSLAAFWSDKFRIRFLSTSSRMTVAIAFNTDEMVLNAPAYKQAVNNPGTPFMCPSLFTTKYGRTYQEFTAQI